jgi:dTDP-4-amino-4,6-dideoxygalactose transaminase
MALAQDSVAAETFPKSFRSSTNVVPFNVLETSTWDLCKGFGFAFTSSDPIEALRLELRRWLQNDNVFFCPSGEAGIGQILSLLPQTEVVMPAWICHQVKVAARLAGKKIIFVDLAKNSVNAGAAQYAEVAKPGRVFLIAHLFGVSTDVEEICALARRTDCVTIEDAVPAIGGYRGGKPLGTFGDFGVFSFEESKRIPAFRGGFIVANNASLLDPGRLDKHRLIPTKQSMPYGPLATAILQNVITTPWIYRQFTRRALLLRPWLRQIGHKRARKSTPNMAPQAGNLHIPQTPSYTREIHPYQAQLALTMVRRINEIGAQISQIARCYIKAFEGTRIQVHLSPEADHSGLMRFPISFPGKSRSELFRLAQRRGIHLKAMWTEEESCEGLPNCRWAASNLVLLPLYTALSPASARNIAESLIEIDSPLPGGDQQSLKA